MMTLARRKLMKDSPWSPLSLSNSGSAAPLRACGSTLDFSPKLGFHEKVPLSMGLHDG
jgi:hypothetical protein